MADTALTIITDALLDLGVLADEEAPTASMAAGALRKLNNMIDSWKIQRLLAHGSMSYVEPFVANKVFYTIGPGGDIDIDRPDEILYAFVRDTTNGPLQQLDTPLKIYTDEEWANVPLKNEVGTWPNYGVWFNYTAPLVQAYINPIASTSQYSLVIWVQGIITNLTLSQEIVLPSGYKRALTANLCIELAPSYEAQIPDAIVRIATDSKADLKIQNFQPSRLNTMGGAGQYEITSNRIYLR